MMEQTLRVIPWATVSLVRQSLPTHTHTAGPTPQPPGQHLKTAEIGQAHIGIQFGRFEVCNDVSACVPWQSPHIIVFS
jgi:hypothetical protein